MTSLAESSQIVGFFSYSRDDDRDSDGGLSTLRRRIQNELRGQFGRSEAELRLWQDAEAIPPGTLWESQIGGAIEQAVFFIPIITPRVVQSKYCQVEFEKFLARENAIGRTDLVFPILYIDVPQLKDEHRWRDHPLLKAIAARQYVDWCDFRFEPDAPNVRRAIAAFCRTIVAALERDVSAPRAAEEAAHERAAQENAERERETAARERERQEARRKQQEADELARAEREEARERAADEQRRLAAEARQREEANRAAENPATSDAAPSSTLPIAATSAPLDRIAEWALVLQGAFCLLGFAIALVRDFTAVAVPFLIPSLLSVGSGILLHLQGHSAPLVRKFIALTIILNLPLDGFIAYRVTESNRIFEIEPVLTIGGLTGLFIYVSLAVWLISVARRLRAS